MNDHKYEARWSPIDERVYWTDSEGYYRDTRFPILGRDAAEHFVAKLNAPEPADTATVSSERSEQAPPIPCVRVDDTDGRPTWRAMGEDVRTLGGGWSWREYGDCMASWFLGDGTFHGTVYLVRRTQAHQPRTERVPLHELRGRILAGHTWPIVRVGETGPDNTWAAFGDGIPRSAPWTKLTLDADGCVEVLVDGAR
jgi:hypothetical protein